MAARCKWIFWPEPEHDTGRRGPPSATASLSIILGTDVSNFDLDGQLPEIPETNAGNSNRQRMVDLAARDKLTVRQLARRVELQQRGKPLLSGLIGGNPALFSRPNLDFRRFAASLRPKCGPDIRSASTSFASEVLNMAKAVTIKVKLVSSADTGFYYVAKKNSRTMTDKLVKKKYDPVARKHVEFREAKIK